MSLGTLPSLADVIERIGVGFAQARYIISGGGVWFADGSELLLISAVTSAVATEWGLGPVQRGSMVTIVYIGVCAGNLLAGPLADRRGRKQLLLWSYLGIFTFSIISSWSLNFTMLCLVRFLVGLSFGLGQPAVNALANEITPAQWRVVVNTLFQTMFPLGEVYSALLIIADDPSMHDLHWRRLLQLGAIPAIFFWTMAFFTLPESPYWLAQSGKYEEAKHVLSMMAHDNGMAGEPVDFEPPGQDDEENLADVGVEEEAFYSHFSKIWTGPLIATTMIMSYSCFNVNLVYYGSLYGFAQILPTLKSGGEHSHTSAGAELLIGAMWEIPGYVIAMIASVYMPRKLVLKTSCFIALMSIILFVFGADGGRGFIPVLSWHIGYYMMKCIISCLFVMDYIYIGEVYPTVVRSTGSSVNIAFGRVGATLSPLLYEYLRHWTGSFEVFFYFQACTTLINLILVEFLPIETYNAALMHSLNDLEKYQDYGATSGQNEILADDGCTISNENDSQNGG